MKEGNSPSIVLLALTLSYHTGFSVDNDDAAALLPATRKPLKEDINEILDLAMIQYKAKLTDNHGIRFENLKRLFLPVGVRFDQLNKPGLRTSMSSGRSEVRLRIRASARSKSLILAPDSAMCRA